MPRDLILAMLLPGTIGLVLFVLAWRPWQRSSPVTDGYWAAPLAFAVAAGVAMAGLQRHWLIPGVDTGSPAPWPSVPPVNRMQWLLLLALPLAMVGLTDALCRARWWVRGPVALAVLVAMFRLLLSQLTWADVSACAGVAWVGWVMIEFVATRVTGPLMPLALWVSAVAAALLMTDGTSPVLGKTAGALAAVTGAAVAVALVARRGLSLARGGAFVFVALLGGFLAWAHFYGDEAVVTPPRAIATLLLPALAGVVLLPGLRQLKPLPRVAIGLVVLLATAVVVAGPAAKGVAGLMNASAPADPYDLYR